MEKDALMQNGKQETQNRQKRISVSVLFFVLGIDFASWASRIPTIKDNLDMSDGLLGLVLLSSPISSLLTLPLAGWIVTKVGSRKTVLLAALLYSLTLPFIGLAANAWQLAAVLFVFGIGGEFLNIAVNTQAVAVEKLFSKPIMSSFHGFFSLGGMVGAFVGGLMMQFTPAFHLTLMAGVGLLLTLIFQQNLLRHDAPEGEHHPLFVRPTGILVGLGFIAFCCMLGEGAMADWSSVYFEKVLKAPQTFITAGYTAFSLAMATGRFNGDWLTARLGGVRMLQVSGIVSATGLAVALLFPTLYTCIAGFACVGFGYATVVPLVYSAAGNSKTMAPGVALAAVSTLGYLGFLFGPPLIGFVSTATSLPVALGLVVLLSALIAIFSGFAKKE